MARDDDRDRVRTERLTRGARGSLAACLCGDLGIRRDLAERDACRRRQDPALELRERREVDRDVEPPARAAEVLIELTRDGIDAARIGQQARPVRAHDARELGSGRLAAVMDREHALRTDCDPEWPERRIDDAIAHRLESLAPCARQKMLSRVRQLHVHRIASRTFFIASATRCRAASSLHSSACATSAYARPSTLRSTNAAR